MTMTRHRKYGLWLALLATALAISACGIKPKDMLPPEGTDKNNEFPRDYPTGR
jgi:hypothetical protein